MKNEWEKCDVSGFEYGERRPSAKNCKQPEVGKGEKLDSPLKPTEKKMQSCPNLDFSLIRPLLDLWNCRGYICVVLS